MVYVSDSTESRLQAKMKVNVVSDLSSDDDLTNGHDDVFLSDVFAVLASTSEIDFDVKLFSF